jgi:hypothetical protein
MYKNIEFATESKIYVKYDATSKKLVMTDAAN